MTEEAVDQARLLRPGSNCWRVEHADRFAFIVDAAEYFRVARKAMLAARRSIMLIAWDFDARISLEREDGDEGPDELGAFVLWLVERSPDLEIRLLRWDTGALKTLLRGKTFATVLRWKAHPRITLKLDGMHPLAGSHHQKVVAIDDCLAFCGGIDMTSGRWDTRDHKDDEPERCLPGGERYDPWHDATSAFDGDAARAMGDLARDRWHAATGEKLEPVTEPGTCWPEGLEPTFENIRLGISRTRPEMKDIAPIHEIEQVYIDLIGRAKHVVYAESQYFASRRIARAIAQRLAEKDGPEIVIVNPHSAEGWLEPIAMDSARARLVEALRRADRHGRFQIYHPQAGSGTEIYVHAKVVIVDDCCLRVGSSNFNNRSLRLDTECDVVISADEPGNDHLSETVIAIRNELIAEHLGCGADEIARHLEKTRSLIATIEALRGPGRTLVPYVLPELSEAEEWLADNEILDPEGPDMIFEALSQRGLFRGWRFPWAN